MNQDDMTRVCLELLTSNVSYARQVGAIELAVHDRRDISLALADAWSEEANPVVQREIALALQRHKNEIALRLLGSIEAGNKQLDGVINCQLPEPH